MKIGIITLSHFDIPKALRWYDWHKKFGYDVKVLYRNREDFVLPVDFERMPIHGEIARWFLTRVMTNALKYNFDYYVLCHSDTWILDPQFIDKSIKYMIGVNVDCLMSHLQTCPEHFKFSFSKAIWQEYFPGQGREKQNMLNWDINLCNFFTHKGLGIYNEKTIGKIADEVDVPAVMEAFASVKQNPFTIEFAEYLSASEMGKEQFLYALGIGVPVIHGYKEY